MTVERTPSDLFDLAERRGPRSAEMQGAAHRAFLAVLRAASELSQPVVELLRTAGLTSAQYNVLRILRGAGEGGLPCGAIADRLITRDPDITRLLDRMERRRLVTRTRQRDDRRVVLTRITAGALELLTTLDQPVWELHQQQLGHLGPARLRQLAALLDAAVAPDHHSNPAEITLA